MTITSVRQGLWGEVMFLSVFAFLFVFVFGMLTMTKMKVGVGSGGAIFAVLFVSVFWVGDDDQAEGGCGK